MKETRIHKTKNRAPKIGEMPLPPEVASLPVIKAEPWFLIHPDVKEGMLEGPAFDRQNNLYICVGGPQGNFSKILRITPEKQVTTILDSPTAVPAGIAVHKNGRLFVASMSGEILIMNPDGSGLTALRQHYEGKMLALNDLVFDKNGNLYFTDFSGSVNNPVGGVYRLDASDNYATLHQIAGKLAGPNGISLSPSGDTLWIGETIRNAVIRIDLLPDGLAPRPIDGITWPFYSTGGPAGPDSNKVDSAGNLYQCFIFQGRALILNKYGVPVVNVIVPGREKGKHLCTTNLAFKPGTDEAYITAAGEGGLWIYTFPGLADGLTLYSHQ